MAIKFCKICNNMYYMKIDKEKEEQQLQYWCRNCGDSQIISSEDSNCVLERNYNKGEKHYKDFINKYTSEDVTLPRVDNIVCPNKNCPCNNVNDPEKREVIYIKYDNEDIKFIYLCCVCKTAWKNSNSGNKNDLEFLKI